MKPEEIARLEELIAHASMWDENEYPHSYADEMSNIAASLLSSLREKEREAERLTALLQEQNESLQSWIGMYTIAAERAATAFERAAQVCDELAEEGVTNLFEYGAAIRKLSQESKEGE